jgi:hypothetical protein
VSKNSGDCDTQWHLVVLHIKKVLHTTTALQHYVHDNPDLVDEEPSKFERHVPYHVGRSLSIVKKISSRCDSSNPLIFEASTRKKWKINQVLHNNEWMKKIKMDVVTWSCLWLTSMNISGFGSSFPTSTLLRISRILSFGTSRQVGSIPQTRPTMPNFLEQLKIT